MECVYFVSCLVWASKPRVAHAVQCFRTKTRLLIKMTKSLVESYQCKQFFFFILRCSCLDFMIFLAFIAFSELPTSQQNRTDIVQTFDCLLVDRNSTPSTIWHTWNENLVNVRKDIRFTSYYLSLFSRFCPACRHIIEATRKPYMYHNVWANQTKRYDRKKNTVL